MDNRPTSISLKDLGDTRAAKLLICAPSNAAIDEVTRRLKDGVPSANGKLVIPRIIRIGNESSMNLAVRDVSLDALVEARVSSAQIANGKGDTSTDISRAEQALDKIKKDREALQTELQSVGDNEEKRKALESEMQVLQKARIEKSRQLDRARDAARDVTRQMDGARREAREALLREADIICGTLAGVGQESLQQYEFDTVIIDEAAQSVEVSALIPLKYRCTRCILVGGKLVSFRWC
jgi:senataxin